MNIGIISMRYAKALLKFSEENKEEKAVYAEMATLSETFQHVPSLQQALLNPVYSDKQKVTLLISAACGKTQPTQSALRFFELVTEHKRAGYMMFIANSYVTQYRVSKSIIKSKLIVPTQVSATTSKKLQDLVENQTKCHVEFEVKVDKSIGGGFILEYDTYRLVASVRSQLSKLNRALKN